MDKVFSIHLGGTGSLDGAACADLSLPASPYALIDALDKLRLSGGETPCWEITEFLSFEELAPHLNGEGNLHALNALAEKLFILEDEQKTAFAGLLKTQTESPLPLSRLINIAYGTECCHVVGEALNDSQLGRFCAENGFVPGVETLPDAVFNLLDFERIGREHRQREGGVLVERTADHPGGYVEQHSDLTDVFNTLDLSLKTPDYAVLLEVSHNDRSALLKLPAKESEIESIPQVLGEPDWLDLTWRCLDCRVPALAECFSGSEEDIGFLNHLARRLADMEPKTLTAYKALLEVSDCKSLRRANRLMDALDQYIFSPQFSSPLEVAKGELAAILCEEEAKYIIPHLNLYQYGQTLIQRYGGVLTDYGLIERADGQPIHAMENQTQQGGMEAQIDGQL